MTHSSRPGRRRRGGLRRLTVTPDNSTLIIAESQGHKLIAYTIGADGRLSNQQEWAGLGDACVCAKAASPVSSRKVFP
jgi:hypothetical protein